MFSSILLLFSAPLFVQEQGSVIRALVDELERTKTLTLDDMGAPYYVQYSVNDVHNWTAEWAFGGMMSSSSNRSCSLSTDVRVGSWESDNSNAGGGFGGFGGWGGRGRRGGGGGSGAVVLPEDHDYAAIRHAAWLASDSAYKRAIEDYSRKMAEMDESRDSEKPDDFTPSTPVQDIRPLAKLAMGLEGQYAGLTSIFNNYPQVVDGSLRSSGTSMNRYIVSSEGTRIRHGETQYLVRLSLTVETADGLNVSDQRQWFANSPGGMPSASEVKQALESLLAALTGTAQAPLLDGYTGPVLFDDVAAAQLFDALLARGIAGQPGEAGGGRRRFSGGDNLERMMGKRLLPTPFQLWDDPTVSEYQGQPLAGHYSYDQEGVAPQRVDLVGGGKLEALLMARTPTSKLSGSTGHGRGGRGGSVRATVGNLFIEHEKGLSDEELLDALRTTAEMEGLDYGLRISALTPGMASMMSSGNMRDMRAFFQRQRGGGGGAPSPLGDPLYVYKVYVEDGREELVRGLEFDSVSVSTLRDIVFAGKDQVVWNRGGSTPSTIIAPAVLFEELDLYGIEDDSASDSGLPAPHAREQ